MIEITIDGLNARQRVLADMIWACDSKADVENFISALGTKALRREAEVIVEMLIMATVEQCYDGIGSMDEAQAVINKVK